MAKGNLYVKVTAGPKNETRLCPFCRGVLVSSYPSGNKPGSPMNAYICSNRTCDYKGWNLPELFWDMADRPNVGELKSAYEQFRSSLFAEQEKAEELERAIDRIVALFKAYRERVLKDHYPDWERFKNSGWGEYKNLMEEIEKYMDGEQ